MIAPIKHLIMDEEASKSTEDVVEFQLEPDSELRFEIESKSKKVAVQVTFSNIDEMWITYYYILNSQLKIGYAELFGTELVKGKIYDFFTGAKIAIFTYQGCTISVRGETDVIYVAKETPMVYNNKL